MISTWQYTKVPSRINLKRELMPQRAESDNGLYGVDPAWQHEVLSMWYFTGSTQNPVTMPEEPNSVFMNDIRLLAFAIKHAQETALYKRFLSSAPTAAFTDPAEPNSRAVSFGEVPADVAKGDLVRRKDVEDMYDWMKGVKVYRSSAAASLPGSFTFTTESGWDGHSDWSNIPGMPSSRPTAFRQWEWQSESTSPDSPWHDLDGGHWVRRVAAPFTVSASLPSMPFIDSVASAFVKASWYENYNLTETTGDMYIPLSDVTLSGQTLSGTFFPAAAFAAMGKAEQPYAPGTTNICQLFHSIGTELVCFFNLSDDYRHPLATND